MGFCRCAQWLSPCFNILIKRFAPTKLATFTQAQANTQAGHKNTKYKKVNTTKSKKKYRKKRQNKSK